MKPIVWVSLLFCAGLVVCAVATGQEHRPWETCYLIEGKDEGCAAGDASQPFDAFLQTQLWAKDPEIGGEVSFDLSQSKSPTPATWKDIGSLSGHRVRMVHFDFADILLIERARGIFAPLMKWSGHMPAPSVREAGRQSVLVMDKNWGGNVPMVQTWAWIWMESGPRQIDVANAVSAAIQEVAPGHDGYEVGIDWDTLRATTWTWGGDYPGKVGVSEKVEIWFEFKNGALQPIRVELSDRNGQKKVWTPDRK
jgi:hypothetical protein